MLSSSTPLRLSADVKLARPQRDVALLLRENSSAPLKLSGVSADLAQQLEAGTSSAALLNLLVKYHPEATAEQRSQALNAFIARLQQAGMIDDGVQRAPALAPVAGRYALPNPDGLALRIAGGLRVLPRGLGATLLLSAGAVALIGVIFNLPRLNSWMVGGEFHGGQWLAVLIGLPVWLVLHELSHAITCRLYGCPVLGAGLQFRGWWLPSAFVNTSAIALFPQRGIKVAVALAGPMMDLLLLGVLALLGRTSLAATVQPLLLLMLCGLMFNLTPFRLSDATRAFQAFAHAGTTPGALSWSAAGRLAFRSYCVCYSLMFGALFAWISLMSWQRMNLWLNAGGWS